MTEVSNTTAALIAMLQQRDAAGRAKYGATLDRTDLTLEQWLQHQVEELLDGAGYALAAMRTLRESAALSQTAGVAREWTPLDIQTFARAYKAEVPGAVLTVHGIDAGLHALAAAPAASGGEANPSTCIHRFGHDGRVCLRCGWNFRENGDPPHPPSTASVSERALVKIEQTACKCHPETCCCGPYTLTLDGEFIASGHETHVKHAARAIEQALTQQRGDGPSDAGVEVAEYQFRCLDRYSDVVFFDWKKTTKHEYERIERLSPIVHSELTRTELRKLYTTPQPSADAGVPEYRRGIVDAQHALHDVANRRRHPEAVAFAQELLDRLVQMHGEAERSR